MIISKTQISFQANPVSINAATMELSACQEVDRQTDRQTIFQLYI